MSDTNSSIPEPSRAVASGDPARPRRAWRWILPLALAGVVTLGATTAWSHRSGGPAGFGPPFGMHGMHEMRGGFSPERAERMVRHMLVEVDATGEQQDKAAAVVRQAITDIRPLMEQRRESRRRIFELLAAPTVDRAAVERLRAEQVQAMDQASQRITQAMLDVAAVLTPEQRQKLVKEWTERRGPRERRDRDRD